MRPPDPHHADEGTNLTEDRLKIAVFVDFDNIEIGVKTTLNRNFEIAAVLDAIRERGEIVTKVAYGDWKRAGDYGRQMGQHAIQMVQRNLTPGGDKNGADINLALDALEMAFTRNHINAFVIVGGDSDFITLVEKLKQYDKKVFVVGGRAFTSNIMQENCHEFIAYENLIRGPSRRQSGGQARPGTSELRPDKALPLVLRAVQILNDREVSPQLGLLKSTLLQLDSTFSERNYGTSSFRDFIEKLARTGRVKLKHLDRSIIVELPDEVEDRENDREPSRPRRPRSRTSRDTQTTEPAEVNGNVALPGDEGNVAVREDVGNGAVRLEEGVEVVRKAFDKSEKVPKWPLYLRSMKQFIKASDPDFDERAFGFSGLQDLARHAQKAGLFRLERNRQDVLRIFPGDELERMLKPPTETSDTSTEAMAPEAATSDVDAVAVTEAPAAADERAAPESKPKATKRKTAAKKKTTKKAAKKKTTAKKKTVRKTTKKAAPKAASAKEEPAPEAAED